MVLLLLPLEYLKLFIHVLLRQSIKDILEMSVSYWVIVIYIFLGLLNLNRSLNWSRLCCFFWRNCSLWQFQRQSFLSPYESFWIVNVINISWLIPNGGISIRYHILLAIINNKFKLWSHHHTDFICFEAFQFGIILEINFLVPWLLCKTAKQLNFSLGIYVIRRF